MVQGEQVLSSLVPCEESVLPIQIQMDNSDSNNSTSIAMTGDRLNVSLMILNE